MFVCFKIKINNGGSKHTYTNARCHVEVGTSGDLLLFSFCSKRKIQQNGGPKPPPPLIPANFRFSRFRPAGYFRSGDCVFSSAESRDRKGRKGEVGAGGLGGGLGGCLFAIEFI